MAKSAAWQRKEGKNPKGGLNAKGRASAKAQGMNLKVDLILTVTFTKTHKVLPINGLAQLVSVFLVHLIRKHKQVAVLQTTKV
jgi:hypothetical protein